MNIQDDQELIDYEQTFNEYWKDIVCDDHGVIDLDKVKRELHDYCIVIKEVTKVYDNITGGEITNPNADARHVIRAVQQYFSE